MGVKRGVRLIVVFLLLAVFASMAGVAGLYFLVSRPPAVAADSVLVLPVPGGLTEHACGPLPECLVSILVHFPLAGRPRMYDSKHSILQSLCLH